VQRGQRLLAGPLRKYKPEVGLPLMNALLRTLPSGPASSAVAAIGASVAGMQGRKETASAMCSAYFQQAPRLRSPSPHLW
jgi:hypothetical protein